MLLEAMVLSSTGAAVWFNVFKKGEMRSLPRKRKIKSVILEPQKTSGKFSVLSLAKDFRKTVKEQGRQSLQIDISPELKEAAVQARKEGNRNLVISVGATGLALMGSVYPGLWVVSTLGIVYLSRQLLIRVYNDVKRGHYISVYMIDFLSTFGLVLTGHILMAAIAGSIGGFFAKVINKLEENSQQQLLGVFSGHPQKVWLLREGVEVLVNFSVIQPGDKVVVNAGEVIPVDGLVGSGEGNVDQHVLTGESQPIEKGEGDQVFASTLLLSGRLTVVVEKAGSTTVAAKIGDALNNTQSYKDTLMVRGRKIADRFAPLTLGLTAFTLPVLGVNSALAVLWSSFGDTLAASGPLSLLSYLQILSRKNILIKDGRVFDSLRDVDTVIFDKTGTLTQEQPVVGKIHVFAGADEKAVLGYAAAAEYRQTHPIAKAILARAELNQLSLPRIDEASYDVGYGIKVTVDGKLVRVGSARFLEREGIDFPDGVVAVQQQADLDNYSLVYVSIDNELGGILEMQPVLRPEVKELIPYLKQRGLKLYILSGDHEAPTRKVAEALGIKEYFAEVLPQDKAGLVQRLRDEGRFVCFIGDGINDAVALKTAQVSVSLKGASSVATDTAQIIFMDGALKNLRPLLEYADDFEVSMVRNIAISVVPGMLTVAGVYFLGLGVVSAMVIFYVSCFAALGSVLWPLIKHQEQTGELIDAEKNVLLEEDNVAAIESDTAYPGKQPELDRPKQIK